MTAKGRQQRAQATAGDLLASATRLFGERGYADTTLDDIALDCGLTIGAIYHHFGNKKALFAAVNEAAEQRILDQPRPSAADSIDPARDLYRGWRTFLDLCEDPGFRRIVLVDSPNILGRDRWATSSVSRDMEAGANHDQELTLRILRGAMAEAALALAEHNNREQTRQLIDAIVGTLLGAVADRFGGDDTAPPPHRSITEGK